MPNEHKADNIERIINNIINAGLDVHIPAKPIMITTNTRSVAAS
jgi:hypothetical protein